MYKVWELKDGSSTVIRQKNGEYCRLPLNIIKSRTASVADLCEKSDYIGNYVVDLGRYLGFVSNGQFIESTTEEEGKMYSHDDLRELVRTLSTGDKIFLANHLFKHYEVYPTKLRGAVEEYQTLKFSVGDQVKTTADADLEGEVPTDFPGEVVEVDAEDKTLPYKVNFGPVYGNAWVGPKGLEEFDFSDIFAG